ncbi:MAG: M1 family metallopeptidase [Anaerolineae bacterium]|nr:M1 family metallopeptidase [Thermoflexales bacterium]MDW8408396.1 M1 family metallopeptidase [Anaerolineae bacterium]
MPTRIWKKQKRFVQRVALPALSLILVAACTRIGTSGAPIQFRPTADPDVNFQPARLIAPAPMTLDNPPERPLYTLNVTLDYESGTLHTQEKIEFRNPTGLAITEIKLNVPPARRAGAIDVRDARIFGQAQPLTFEMTNTVLTVQLPAPLPPDAGIALAFDYVLRIPLQETVIGIGGDDSSRGPYSLTAGHWYILLAPWQNGDWHTPGYVPIGDNYIAEVADYEVNILAPEGVVVAGAGEESREGRLWRYSLPKARVFAFGASPVYQIDQIEQDGITYIHYTYPQHRQFSEAVLYTAARAVKLYSELYGPYPYRILRIIETGRTQGQEYSGMVGIGTVLYEGYPGRGARHDLIATTAHEVAHQWWFHLVGNDQIRSPWLDESLARMSEMRFYERYYPRDVDWWYQRYIAAGRLRGSIDLPLSAYPDGRAYIAAVYQRGLVFLRDVRARLGDTAFDAALRDYAQTLTYEMATPDDFFNALARHTSEDLSDLVNGYFAAPPVLPCRISNNAVGCRR